MSPFSPIKRKRPLLSANSATLFAAVASPAPAPPAPTHRRPKPRQLWYPGLTTRIPFRMRTTKLP